MIDDDVLTQTTCPLEDLAPIGEITVRRVRRSRPLVTLKHMGFGQPAIVVDVLAGDADKLVEGDLVIRMPRHLLRLTRGPRLWPNFMFGPGPLMVLVDLDVTARERA